MPTFYTRRQIAEKLQAHEDTVSRMVERGYLPRPIKLAPGRNGAVRFPAAAVDAALAKLYETTR
jgi:excisionase family DNA binding protein